MTIPQQILDFWFGTEASHGIASRDAWFKKDAAFDDEIRRRFASDVEKAIAGDFSSWEETPDGALALILLLDQFPRNLYRGNRHAFDGDARALSVAEAALRLDFDKNRPALERLFFYLPFEHSERFVDQDRSVELIGALGNVELTDYAVRHRDIVQRFGRFPHRNKVMRRASTAEEEAFLNEPGSSF